MAQNIYKTEAGRRIIEAVYEGRLAGYSAYPFEQMFVPTKIARTHVLRFGDPENPPLILLHGSVSNSAAWLGNIADFIDIFCVYCVDIPGEPGLSEPHRCQLHSEEPNEWLVSLFASLHIKRAYFASMSLGSWYALNFAVRNPDTVAALSMLTAGGLVPAKASFIWQAALFMLLGQRGQKMLSRLVYHKAEVPPEVLEFQALTAKHFNSVLEALPIFTDEHLRRINFPVQFFGGECDALIDSVKTAERLRHLLPSADIHVLKDTGHAIIDKFSDIKDFLASIEQSKS